MKAILVTIMAAALLSACGTDRTDRLASGAGIGAGVGLLAGPPGVIVGALAGGAAGAATSPRDVNLGKPAWK